MAEAVGRVPSKRRKREKMVVTRVDTRSSGAAGGGH